MTSIPKPAPSAKVFSASSAAPGDPRSRLAQLATSEGGIWPPQPPTALSSVSDDEPVVFVTSYKKGHLHKEFMAWRRRCRLQTDRLDLLVDMIQNRVVVRKRNGKSLVHEHGVRGIGDIVFALVPKLLRSPGFFRTRAELAAMEPRYDSHYACIQTYMCRLRKLVFGESERTQYFILSRPGPTYAFNGDLSFCLIERVASSEPSD